MIKGHGVAGLTCSWSWVVGEDAVISLGVQSKGYLEIWALCCWRKGSNSLPFASP